MDMVEKIVYLWIDLMIIDGQMLGVNDLSITYVRKGMFYDRFCLFSLYAHS